MESLKVENQAAQHGIMAVVIIQVKGHPSMIEIQSIQILQIHVHKLDGKWISSMMAYSFGNSHSHTRAKKNELVSFA